MDTKNKLMIFTLLLAGICSPVFSGEWRAHVVKSLDVLVSSCVVVPCSFTHPGGNLPTSRLRGIWHRRDKPQENIFHEDNTQILDSFKGRTRMLGHLGQNNCTLEIVYVRDHDNGPFCFRIEPVRMEDKFSFVEECVEFNILSDAPVPTLNHPPTAIEGQPYTVTCSIIHTCPSHWPKLSWTGKDGDVREYHKDIRSGNWETQSILTFVPEAKDDHSEITCSAEHFGGRTSSKSFSLFVKPDAPDPTLIHPLTAIEGQPYTVTCSIIHTYPSHWPKLSWTRKDGDVREYHKDIRSGNWETQSILTFVPEAKDDHSEITCTAEFFGGITSSKSFSLFVKRTENYNHIIIPTAVAIGTALIFGLLCIFMAKKYKNRIRERQNREGRGRS